MLLTITTTHRPATDLAADAETGLAFLGRVRSAVGAAGLWEELGTDWVALDGELMPWSLKAQELLRRQYAPVASAGEASLAAVADVLTAASARLPGDEGLPVLRDRFAARRAEVERYRAAYRPYAWPTDGLAGVRFAPFLILASEGSVHLDRSHADHLATLSRLAEADPELVAVTPSGRVDLADPASRAAAVAWWEELTAGGGEGFVVKPTHVEVTGDRGLVQPGVKVRGREYLRLIYGPEYALPEHLERLRARSLGAKRALALREFALGLEALERFVRREPLRRVHECVFALLALESDPVDPRL